MNFYRILLSCTIIILLCFSINVRASEANSKTSLNKEIQNILDVNRAKYNLPAISLTIKLPNNEIKNYVSGYYTLSQNKNITPETLFQIGSITKSFTATIIFKLIEENKLTINDRLAKWLPQYPRWKNITINNLLRHTSGVYNYTHGKHFDQSLRKNPNKYWSLNELADISYNHSDMFKPGTKYSYTNTDYVLLGMIIEKMTYRSLQQIFDKYLHDYHLNNTYYVPFSYPRHVITRIAHGYNRDGTFKFNKDVTFTSLSMAQSAGALISTPNDLIKWLTLLFSGKIISNKSLADMKAIISEINAKPINLPKTAPNLVKNKPFSEVGVGAGIGLIYFKNNGFAWVHAGGTPGYEAFYMYNPRMDTYLALAYSVKPKQQFIFISIADEIFRALNTSYCRQFPSN